MRETLKQDNTRVISFVILYENSKSLILNVLGDVVYCLVENIYMCWLFES